jgi:hypothetical protein
MDTQDWKLVAHFCHHSSNGITEEQYRTAWNLADGFGRVPWWEAAEREFFGDWSHFRDSSEPAIKAVADYLRREDLGLPCGICPERAIEYRESDGELFAACREHTRHLDGWIRDFRAENAADSRAAAYAGRE